MTTISDLIPICFKVDKETDNTLNSLVAKKGGNKSEMVRRLVNIGLEKELAKESIDFVRDQINEEIKSTCFPQFERVAKLNAKIGYQSVANFYLLAYIMDSILPPTKHKEFEEIKRNAKAMAIAYLKLTPEEFDDFMKSETIALDMLDLK
ncbi:hypothetical protein RBG61_06410 [Paludicola sp. MB14-C6]|uniref:hypothetical protein n=1 Tax=Paludihabitans sp. MB14-C6 TaxID=3070656 RepID=UPI0027DE207E|nr:hypothetical protein [Paludicola sp. MB14-C6]WMJ24293.1 hypothetical protein RBG61_06410 [Paludicola sp. MB14-C6]